MKTWTWALFAMLSWNALPCYMSNLIDDVAFGIMFMMDPNTTDVEDEPCSESDDEAIEQGIFDGLGILLAANQTNSTDDDHNRMLRSRSEFSPKTISSTGFCQTACDDERGGACIYLTHPACERQLQEQYNMAPSHTRREKDMDAAAVESLESVEEFLDQVVERISGLELIDDLTSMRGQHCLKGKNSIHSALDSADLTESCSKFVHRNMSIQCYKVANFTIVDDGDDSK